MTFIHAKELHKLEGNKPFTITFVKKDGEVVTVRDATMTSFYSAGLTMKIKFPGYNHPITLRRSQVLAINKKELIV
jgi:hypothetical protein